MSLKMFSQPIRNFVTSAVRRSEYPEGFPGANLPFSLDNRYKVTLIFTLFFGSGSAIPYLILRYRLLQ
ncbi:cytochrome c oxidase subunit 7C [Ptiloglossa arizonensis]|uniref:cytochrome c oxidase subunit 7C n=1 Tax=Ptiloglossa arizonensis TaxID=3350558 RepID=UPI003F9F5C46